MFHVVGFEHSFPYQVLASVVLHVANVEGDLVPGVDEVLVRGRVLWLHVPAVGQRQVLLGQLEHQLAVAVLLARGAQLGHLGRGQRREVVGDLRERERTLSKVRSGSQAEGDGIYCRNSWLPGLGLCSFKAGEKTDERRKLIKH